MLSNRMRPKEKLMYIARFSYHVLPADRGRAIEYIQREVDAARQKKLGSRLLVPLTRGEGGPSLQFEVEIENLEQFDEFRQRGIGASEKDTGTWMHAFSQILTCPPHVELLRVERNSG
jgi:hypothetical protein